jgi:hypothetical protein
LVELYVRYAEIRSLPGHLLDAAQVTGDSVYLSKSTRSEANAGLVVAFKLDAALVGVRLGLFRDAHGLRQYHPTEWIACSAVPHGDLRGGSAPI